MGKNKDIQLNLTRRRIIFDGLSEGKKATEIASILKRHKSTISREIKNYRYLSFKADKNHQFARHAYYFISKNFCNHIS